MTRRYEPKSEFLKAVIAEEAPLTGHELAGANLARLIAMIRDEDLSNRDWATFLLAQGGMDTLHVRDALHRAAKEQAGIVRAEAVLGLAMRDKNLALPFVQEALRADYVFIPMLEAAEICAHPSLIDDLRVWAEPSDQPFLDGIAADALAACERASR